jgi:hypothetical protein
MIRATIEVQGLNELHLRIGSNALDPELRKAEKDALALVKERARSNAASFSSLLPQSVQSSVDGGGLSGIIGSVAKTALSIETGRKKGEMPSFESIERWMTRKGIAGGSAQRISTHRRVRLSGSQKSALHDDAVGIAFKIRDSGTKALPFIIPAATAEKERVQKTFQDAVTRVLKKWAGK